MKLQHKANALLLLFLLASSPVMAEDEVRDQFNPVRTAVTSQTIAPDARAGGMGDVGVATAPAVHSQYWNPAKNPFTISRAGIAINYTPWLRKHTTPKPLLHPDPTHPQTHPPTAPPPPTHNIPPPGSRGIATHICIGILTVR